MVGSLSRGRIAAALALVVVAAAGFFLHRLLDRPDLAPYLRFQPPLISQPLPPGSVSVTFLGVATLLITDGETSLMTDGFFTRPGIRGLLFGGIEPNREVIAASLARAGIKTLAAVIPVHSHYDHVMDAPEVARLTGAELVGSESTANVGRGWGLPPSRIRVVWPGDVVEYGKFKVTFIDSVHVPLPSFLSPDADGVREIREPLRPPSGAFAYKLGNAWSLLIEHPSGSILVQGSAGFVPGRLNRLHADVVFLGTGGLGAQTEEYRNAYFREVVLAVGAKRLIPIHWDDMTRPLSEPLRPNLNLGGGFRSEMEFLIAHAASHDLQLQFLPAWGSTVLFPGRTP